MAPASYLDALAAASFAGISAAGVGVAQIAQVVLAAPWPDPLLPADLLLDGVATQITDGYGSGVPMLKQALGALRREEVSDEEQLRCSLIAYRSAVDLWDDESWYVLATRYLELARVVEHCRSFILRSTLRIVADGLPGSCPRNSLLEELRRVVCDIIGSAVPPYAPLALVAWKGPEADVSRLIEETEKEALARGETLAVSAARWTSAVFYNGLGPQQSGCGGRAGVQSRRPGGTPIGVSLSSFWRRGAHREPGARRGALQQLPREQLNLRPRTHKGPVRPLCAAQSQDLASPGSSFVYRKQRNCLLS